VTDATKGTSMTIVEDVLGFWFDGDRVRPEWFRKNAQFDAQIRARFGATIEAGLGGALDHWSCSVPGALAQVIVLDQFTRNAFRDTPRAFAGDTRALAVARALVANGQHGTLRPVERQFVYLPFEHAEDLACQQEALRLFGALAAEAPELGELVEWARRHHDVIARFGRFPHRNAILGRASTTEEIEFLKQPGSSF
jgi:uncharacterized protein (DUF924 family)